jgi:hypothetical protein
MLVPGQISALVVDNAYARAAAAATLPDWSSRETRRPVPAGNDAGEEAVPSPSHP